MHVTVSGASGFVGARILAACRTAQLTCNPVSLRGVSSVHLPPGEVLVHLASIAHTNHPDQNIVFAVNRDLAIATAEVAKRQGYRQFIFLSSALVWGSKHETVKVHTPEHPDTAYGRAKLEAEIALTALETPEFGITILRPPLVYGPGVKGNLAKLLSAVHRWPVCPLGVRHNRRSLLHVDNLVALILHLARTKQTGTFCPVDEPPLSTFEILQLMASQMPRHGRVVEMPFAFRKLLNRSVPGTARRLFGSFVIEDDSVRHTGFVPPFTIEDGFQKMVEAYLSREMKA